MEKVLYKGILKNKEVLRVNENEDKSFSLIYEKYDGPVDYTNKKLLEHDLSNLIKFIEITHASKINHDINLLSLKENSSKDSLKSILFEDDELKTIPAKKLGSAEKKNLLKNISEYPKLVEEIKNNDYVQILNKVKGIVSDAETLILNSTPDFINQNTVKADLKTIKTSLSELEKISSELNDLHQRLLIKYDDCGYILNRYFEFSNKN